MSVPVALPRSTSRPGKSATKVNAGSSQKKSEWLLHKLVVRQDLLDLVGLGLMAFDDGETPPFRLDCFLAFISCSNLLRLVVASWDVPTQCLTSR